MIIFLSHLEQLSWSQIEMSIYKERGEGIDWSQTHLLYVFFHGLPCTPVHALQLSWPLLTR